MPTGPDATAAEKRRTRQAVAQAIERLTPGERRAASVALAENLAEVPAVTQARTLMAFLSLPTEIDTWPVIRWAWQHGKRIAIPRIQTGPDGDRTPTDRRDMVAVLLEKADASNVSAHPHVRPGPLGILHAPDAPVVPPGRIDVVLLPCQAVDRRGNRLGKGGGFYDRFLARADVTAKRIAVAFRRQVLDAVPVTDNDQRVDMVVTDGEVLVFERPDGQDKPGGQMPNA